MFARRKRVPAVREKPFVRAGSAGKERSPPAPFPSQISPRIHRLLSADRTRREVPKIRVKFNGSTLPREGSRSSTGYFGTLSSLGEYPTSFNERAFTPKVIFTIPPRFAKFLAATNARSRLPRSIYTSWRTVKRVHF